MLNLCDVQVAVLLTLMPRRAEYPSGDADLPRDNTRRLEVARYPRLTCGVFFADFRRDVRLLPEVYHCIIQRKQSKDVLWWTQHRSLQEAVEAAEKELVRLGTGTLQRAA